MLFLPYQFKALIEEHRFDERLAYSVVWVPKAIANELPLDSNPRLRISGEINGVPLEAALMPVRGKWYILISKRLMKAAKASLGDDVSVQFGIADQDAVNVPRALEDALLEMPDLKAVWDNLTPGKRRGLAYRVSVAKTEPTIIKRVDEVLEQLAEI